MTPCDGSDYVSQEICHAWIGCGPSSHEADRAKRKAIASFGDLVIAVFQFDAPQFQTSSVFQDRDALKKKIGKCRHIVAAKHDALLVRLRRLAMTISERADFRFVAAARHRTPSAIAFARVVQKKHRASLAFALT
jgi:hypothetical protein